MKIKRLLHKKIFIFIEIFILLFISIQNANAYYTDFDFSDSGSYTLSNTGLENISDGLGQLTSQYSQIGVVSNSTNLNGAYDMVVDGNYAYVTSYLGDKLSVVDISNPSSPSIVATVSNNGSTIRLDGASGIIKDGNYLYIASQVSDALQIINVSTPTSPTAVGYLYDGTNLNGARGITKSGNYVYIAADTNDSLTVVNVSNPSSPSLAGHYKNSTTMNGARGVKASGNYVFVSCYDRDALSVINISNPSSPTYVTQIRDSTNLNGAWKMAISGSYLYVSAYLNSSVRVIDISTPTAPTAVTNISGGSFSLTNPMGLFVDGSYLYITSYGSDTVNIANISTPTSPSYVTKMTNSTSLNGAYGVYKSGNYIYVAAYENNSLTILGPTYSSTSPYIIPNSGVLYDGSIDEITTTYGSGNQGNITYQISKDDGNTWYYLSGTSRITTTGGTTYSNTPTEINSEIQTFNGLSGGTGKFKWKAFLNSDGTQKVELDNVKIDYTAASTSDTIDFETPGGYTVTQGTWSRVTTEYYEGTYSLQSGNTTDSSTSCFNVTKNIYTDSTLSFYKKVSSESGYDFLEFYIDGTEQNKWSGEVDWSQQSYSIGNGSHTFEWCYSKDYSVSEGSDAAWIDLIQLVPQTQVNETSVLDFETPGGYTITTSVTGSGTDWERVTDEKYEGLYSLQSQNTSNSTTACFEREETIGTTDTGLGFYYKVSSEENYDYLTFYVDGTEEAKWSGEIGWQEEQYTISPGTYTFSWCYSKDSSVSNGSDAAWIDYVTVISTPPVLEEITPVLTPTNDDTPDYTFYSPMAGSIAYSGSCNSSTNTGAVVGNNTITFDHLADGIYTDCTVQVEGSPQSSTILNVTDFTIDTTGINITINYPVDSSTIPNSSFNLDVSYYDEETGANTGSIIIGLYKWNGTTYGSDLSSTYVNYTGATIIETGAIFPISALPGGTYKIDFTISDNIGNDGTATSVFDVSYGDSIAPDINYIFPSSSGSLFPNANLNFEINYYDTGGVNTGSIQTVLEKWNGTSWGSDLLSSYLIGTTITSTGEILNLSKLGYGKYKFNFYVADIYGNGNSKEQTFYIDEPEIIISSGSLDLGDLTGTGLTFSDDEIIVTIKTVGAPFELQLIKDSDFLDGSGDLIIDWDGTSGVGYDKKPYTFTNYNINNYPIVGTGVADINVNGDKNMYTFPIKIGTSIQEEQAAGIYDMSILFRAIFGY